MAYLIRICFLVLLFQFGLVLYGQDTLMNVSLNFDSLRPKLMLPISHSRAGVVLSEYSPDGNYLLTCGADKTAKIWDLKSRKLIHNLVMHQGGIESGHFSPNGEYILTTSEDKTAKIWKAKTGEIVHDLTGHKNWVVSSGFSPDGKSIVTASWDGTAKIWDTESGKLMYNLTGHKENIWYTEFSPSGNQIITVSADGTAKLWNPYSGEVIHELVGSMTTGHFSPNGKLVVTGSWDKTAKVWETESGILVHDLAGHKSTVTEILFSADNTQIFTSGEDGTVKIWDAKTGELISTLDGHKGEVLSLYLSPDGRQMATVGKDGLAKVRDIQTGELIFELKSNVRKSWFTKSKAFRSAQFSPDGRFIFIHGRLPSQIWDIQSGKLIHTFNSSSRSISKFENCSTKNQVLILSTGRKGSQNEVDLKAWDTMLKRVEIDFPNGIVRSEYSPDGNYILTIDKSETCKVWDSDSGEIVCEFKVDFSIDLMNSFMEFSSDSKYVFYADAEGNVTKWDAQTGKLIFDFPLPDFPDPPEFMGMKAIIYNWSLDKNYLLACSNNVAYVWDINARKLVRTIKVPPSELTPEMKDQIDFLFLMSVSQFPLEGKFSPDGKYFLTTKQIEKDVKLFESSTGELKQEFIGHKDFVTSAKFNSNGKHLLTTSYDHTAKVWEVNSGKLIYDLAGHEAPVKQALYSPDGKQIATIGEDNRIKIWDTHSGKLLFTLGGFASSTIGISGFLQYNPRGDLIQLILSDGSMVFWNALTGEKLIQLYMADQTNWIAIHPSGLFDASSDAMQIMYFVVGNEVIEFNQLKDRYYEPGLYEKVMAGESLRNVEAFERVSMYPEINSTIKNHELSIQLKERNGGIGKVSLFVNNKEVIPDANAGRDSALRIDLTQFEKYYLKDTFNTVSIRAYNGAGWLKSAAVDHTYKPDFINRKGETEGDPILSVVKHDPHLHAIIVGTSDYVGNDLDLQFADKDSRDIASAVEQSASLLFGAEKVNLYWFTSNGTGGSEPGTKNNIKAAIGSIALKAKAEDVLLLYFSGHGVTYGSSFENEQFYYLTKDVSSGDLSDPQIRNSYAISTDEMTEWVNSIAAQKQVMILDACSSGKVVEDILAVRNVPTSQIRALDRMKDRTGMFVLAGSAADKVSYEASQFGQGLLTYSLLLGMSGSALKDGKSVDVMQLFQFARDQVPEFAANIGGVQTPTLASPTDASSFDIGLVNEDIEIPIQAVKPLFTRSNFQDEDKVRDVLRLSKALDTYLIDATLGPSSKGIIFVDVDEFKNAYSINGRYKIQGEDVKVNVSLFKGEEKLTEFIVSGSKSQLEELVKDILNQVVKLINQ